MLQNTVQGRYFEVVDVLKMAGATARVEDELWSDMLSDSDELIDSESDIYG
jgi:hypothetical protein